MLDRADLGQVVGQGLGVEGLDRVGVHERGEEVADLAGLAARRGVAGRGLLEDGLHVELGLVVQGVERAVGRPVGRDLGLGQPPAVDVAEQVVLRPHVVGQLADRDPADGAGAHRAPPRRSRRPGHPGITRGQRRGLPPASRPLSGSGSFTSSTVTFTSTTLRPSMRCVWTATLDCTLRATSITT